MPSTRWKTSGRGQDATILNDVTDRNPRGWLARVGRFALPSGATRDAGIILSARTLRGFGDGFVSVLLPVRLADLGFGSSAVGAIASATLFGSAFATLVSGLYAGRLGVQKTLIACSMLMVATGIGFATATDFWLLLMIAFLGTLNPTANDCACAIAHLALWPLPHAWVSGGRVRCALRWSSFSTRAAYGFQRNR